MTLIDGMNRYQERHPARRQPLDAGGDVVPARSNSRRETSARRIGQPTDQERELKRLQQSARSGMLSAVDARRLSELAMKRVDELDRLRTGRQL